MNFGLFSSGNPLPRLPIDPVNTTSTGSYYTYTPGGSWELAAALESSQYRMGGSKDRTSSDGGHYPDLYEAGTNLTLTPIDYGDPALVGYWTFDEGSGATVYDASGGGNNGTLSLPAPTWTSGKVNGALNFNGSNNYVNLTGSASSFQFGTGNFSISAWVYFNSTTNFESIVTKKAAPASAQGFSIYYNGSTQKLMYSVADGTTAYERYTVNTISTGAWHHIVMVADSNDQNFGYYYVDGVKWVLASASANVNVNNALTLYIGDTNGYPFNGIIDDVRIYGRALSAAEIQALYNSQK